MSLSCGAAHRADGRPFRPHRTANKQRHIVRQACRRPRRIRAPDQLGGRSSVKRTSGNAHVRQRQAPPALTGGRSLIAAHGVDRLYVELRGHGCALGCRDLGGEPIATRHGCATRRCRRPPDPPWSSAPSCRDRSRRVRCGGGNAFRRFSNPPTQREDGERGMRAVHAPLGRSLSTFLNCHGCYVLSSFLQ